ncbi:PLP-dependent aminotransferase family protein [Streptococcus gallolyticus]|nr:PLP-dependent aminotransferase family protein [Streptococcus gallolyticus]MBY5041647.1 PLP-dependent aminotransferase family protein [Streptococcus gallolyticus]
MHSKYQTIIQDILQGIENQTFKRGQKLPSIRKLSQEYGCSKDTVQKAMLELKYRNKIYAVEKSGYYILEDKEFQEEKLELNPQDFQNLPYDDFRLCLNESLIGRENYLFNYYHQQEGLEELIESVQQLLVDYDVYAKKDQIVTTAGSQQALYILSQLNIGNGQGQMLLEEPTYHRMKDLLDGQGLSYQTIERTLEGIDLKELERIFRTEKISFFYTIPRLHNPLGSSYSDQEKKEIVRLAQAYNVYIIEDDYLADFDPDKQVPLHYLDTQERVIYLKSFTTTLFPALRIGSVALPHELVAPFLHHKGLMDYDTNLIMQKALSLYIDNGMFSRNTRLLQESAHIRQQEMETVLSRNQVPFPYQLGHGQVTFQLATQELTASLKHSKLPLQIIESQYWTYLILPYNKNFSNNIRRLGEMI